MKWGCQCLQKPTCAFDPILVTEIESSIAGRTIWRNSCLFKYNWPSVMEMMFVAMNSVMSEFISSTMGRPVIEDPLIPQCSLPQRSRSPEWILKMSAGNASLLGILARMRESWRYDLAWDDRLSKHTMESLPFSWVFSQNESPIRGKQNDRSAWELEWVHTMSTVYLRRSNAVMICVRAMNRWCYWRTSCCLFSISITQY